MTIDDRDEIDHALLDILVCPQTRSRLIYDREAGELISTKAQIAYPIREGVPIMLVDESRKLSEAEVLRYRDRPAQT